MLWYLIDCNTWYFPPVARKLLAQVWSALHPKGAWASRWNRPKASGTRGFPDELLNRSDRSCPATEHQTRGGTDVPGCRSWSSRQWRRAVLSHHHQAGRLSMRSRLHLLLLPQKSKSFSRRVASDVCRSTRSNASSSSTSLRKTWKKSSLRGTAANQHCWAYPIFAKSWNFRTSTRHRGVALPTISKPMACCSTLPGANSSVSMGGLLG